MDDMRSWTDPRDQRVWDARAYSVFGGQAMAVGNMDISKTRSKTPVLPDVRRIEFIPADGLGHSFRTDMGEDERKTAHPLAPGRSASAA